jgi:hypothetical protein
MHLAQVGIRGGLRGLVTQHHLQKAIHSRIDDQTAHHGRGIRERDVTLTEPAGETNDFRKCGSSQPRISEIDGNGVLDPTERIAQRGLRAKIELAVQTDEQCAPLS